VFHLFAIFVKVVEPDAIKIWRTRFSNWRSAASSTRRNACAVRSLVPSFCSDQTPSRDVSCSPYARHFGRMRHSKPHMLKSRFGLSFE